VGVAARWWQHTEKTLKKLVDGSPGREPGKAAEHREEKSFNEED
jgi:hypothetical protein